MSILGVGIEAVERGLVPDGITRAAIRRLCGAGLYDANDAAFQTSLRDGPIAPFPDRANAQHYELPAEFFTQVLGPRRKYSCCWFANDNATLADAENAALAITCERAELVDGQDVLELGCGWGSLSLWMARHYPHSRITAVSNSGPQRLFIEAEAASRGLHNLQVVTADMNDFDVGAQRFDRVVSVEMFEHMRNYDRLLRRIAAWLQPGGKLFVHIFCHRERTYPFETEGEANWMGRHFFTGGLMPSADLLRQFDRDLKVTRHWTWNGRHYQRTADAWLANLDAHRSDIMPILRAVYGVREARRWLNRWRMFFLAVAELFGAAGGEEWFVSHYLLTPTT